MENNNNVKKLEYRAVHITQIIAGIIFLSVGIISLVFYDYGMLVLFFTLPHFFLTGMIPMLFGLLILLRNMLELEKVTLSSDDETLKINVTWNKTVREKTREIKITDIQYTEFKYRETKTKRWLMIITLVFFTIEADYQNAIDLLGHARIAPLLVLFTVLMFIGIVIFTFFPRRFVEIGMKDEIILIPWKNQPPEKVEMLNQILKISSGVKKRNKPLEILFSNILSHLSSFILSLFLIFLAILLMVTPLFMGSFTRVLALTYGMKLLLKTVNRSPYYCSSDKNKLYMGCSLSLTFLQTVEAESDTKITFSPLRFHPFEILCIFYLISQATKYGFRIIWWPNMGFSLIYFLIGIALVVLLFIKWFNPSCVRIIDFEDYSIKIKETEIRSFMEKPSRFFANFKTIRHDKNLMLSLIIFAIFVVGPILYYILGGNFLII